MELRIHCRDHPFLLSPQIPHLIPPKPFQLKPLRPQLKRRTRNPRQDLIFRISASVNGNGSGDSPWSRISRLVRQSWGNFGELVKREAGVDWGDVNVKVGEVVGRLKGFGEKGEGAFDRVRFESVPAFADWNRWERWKDIKNWEPRRIGVLLVYVFCAFISCQGMFLAYRSRLDRLSKKELTEAYMEALIPEPTPSNIRKLKKSIWRKTMPKGLKMKKFIEGPGGALIHDPSYVGEDAWDDDPETHDENIKQAIEDDAILNPDQKKKLKEELGISDQGSKGWRERFLLWKEILRREKLAEQIDSLNAKYVVDFDMEEVEKSLRKDVVEKSSVSDGSRALWISKRWWRYRPKIPYTYFLHKLDCSEVAAVVFSEDLKRLFVTMKEGFPLEYAVDIPLDPYLFEIISSSGVEVDLLQKRQIDYFLRVLVALTPGILILWLIRESVMLLLITSKRYLYKKYNQLFDMAYADNFILPVSDSNGKRPMSKEVVLGGDVWDLLDELMIYMGNPMDYFEKKVRFVRGVLLSGPPGTGKTLFARTLAKESGMPFVFASGAEFTDSEKSGAARINEIFSIARRNAPSFVFVDEIDAIAGRHARRDPRRRATFEALIAQLDGEKEKTGIDEYSLRQAVIFLCATNRPDELDLEFVRPGRIDRRLYIGLPDAKQRIEIFGVHSEGKQLAEDLVFRTVGYSGADIRNLINEAGIMFIERISGHGNFMRQLRFLGGCLLWLPIYFVTCNWEMRKMRAIAAMESSFERQVRKGHSKIYQQDIVDVLDKQLLEGMGVLLTEEEQQKCEESVPFEKKRLLAVHEAGHILLAHLFPQFDWHAFSQLLPGGKETAISVFYPREDTVDQGYTTFGYLKMQMVVAHGGRCAERIVFGDDFTDGGRDDLEKITKVGVLCMWTVDMLSIAREMVISPRNSRLGLATLVKRVGLRDEPDKADGTLLNFKWDDPRVIPANMTVEVSELFTRELTRYIEETEELAMDGLMKNRHILDLIAKELLERSRITGLEVDAKLKGLSPVMFEDFVQPFQINLEEDAFHHKKHGTQELRGLCLETTNCAINHWTSTLLPSTGAELSITSAQILRTCSVYNDIRRLVSLLYFEQWKLRTFCGKDVAGLRAFRGDNLPWHPQ
ncbi:hypothetical protein Sjap_003729 [Stephania japonica]|uniref:AAA+ ATPase domain-containing protein n=1 Tax=Stephania japonica TaxID=461633 RepID=A0AAP0PVS5_9MAGN